MPPGENLLLEECEPDLCLLFSCCPYHTILPLWVSMGKMKIFSPPFFIPKHSYPAVEDNAGHLHCRIKSTSAKPAPLASAFLHLEISQAPPGAYLVATGNTTLFRNSAFLTYVSVSQSRISSRHGSTTIAILTTLNTGSRITSYFGLSSTNLSEEESSAAPSLAKSHSFHSTVGSTSHGLP